MTNKIKYEVQEIPLDLLEDNPYDKRKKYGDIEGLADSIRERGLQNPISVIKSENRFIIVHGHRRAHAFRYLKAKTIPAIIRKESSPQELMLDLAIENIQRKDLLPVEKGAALEQLFYEIPSVKNIQDVIRLMNLVKMKYEMKYEMKKGVITKKDTKIFDEKDIDRARDILKMLSMSSSKAIMHMKLLLLPQDIQDKIISADNINIPEGMIGVKTGYELTRITDPNIQKELYDKIIKEKMTHAKTRMLVNKIIEDLDSTDKNKDILDSTEAEHPLLDKNKDILASTEAEHPLLDKNKDILASTEAEHPLLDKNKIENIPNKEKNIDRSEKENKQISKLIKDLDLFNSKFENIHSKLRLIVEYKKENLLPTQKTELDASLDRIKLSCLQIISNIDRVIHEDLRNEELFQYLKDINLEVEISEEYRWRLPSKIINLLGAKKGDVLILKIDALKKLSEKLVSI